MEKHELQYMTWKEIEIAYSKNPVIFVPLGSMEEHGPHSVVGDYIAAYEIAKRAAEQSDGYCIPPIPFGYSEFFRGFPGTISVKPQTLYNLVEDVCISLIEHGIKKIMLVSGHYGNAPILDMLARDIRRKYKIMIGKIDLWHAMSPEFKKEAYGMENPSCFGHGGEPVTSVMHYLRPQDMRMDLVNNEDDSVRKWEDFDIKTIALCKLEDVDVNMYFNMEQLSERGIMGDPLYGNKELGEKVVERLVHYCVEFAQLLKNSDTLVK